MDAFRYLCPVHGVVAEFDRDDNDLTPPPGRCSIPDESGQPCGQDLTFVYAQSAISPE